MDKKHDAREEKRPTFLILWSSPRIVGLQFSSQCDGHVLTECHKVIEWPFTNNTKWGHNICNALRTLVIITIQAVITRILLSFMVHNPNIMM